MSVLHHMRTVDKLEQMLGSYGPSQTNEPYVKNFDPEESPSGMLARSGTYNVRSRVIDDDGEVYAGERAQMVLVEYYIADVFSPSKTLNGRSS